MKVHQVAPAQWARISEAAHLVGMNEVHPAALERISYALYATSDDSSDPLGYCTVQEMDGNWALLVCGAAFPEAPKAGRASGADFLLSVLKTKYDYLETNVESGNVAWLRLIMKLGFRVTGVKQTPNKLMVILSWKRS